mmetsp:Transcript_134942/g.336726  ORF Transcript_134942/g.336726 Transcript_134942/m.336726 type:complete len:231 (-) Transcript_134942:469-1161(-)
MEDAQQAVRGAQHQGLPHGLLQAIDPWPLLRVQSEQLPDEEDTDDVVASARLRGVAAEHEDPRVAPREQVLDGLRVDDVIVREHLRLTQRLRHVARDLVCHLQDTDDHIDLLPFQTLRLQRPRRGLQLGAAVVAALAMAEATVQHQADRPDDGQEEPTGHAHEGREEGGKAELIGSREQRRGHDLAEDEHHGHGDEDGQPARQDLVQEQGQGLVGGCIDQQQGHQQAVAV